LVWFSTILLRILLLKKGKNNYKGSNKILRKQLKTSEESKMKQLNPQWCEWILPIINSSPFFSFLGIRLNELKFGESCLELDLKKNHLQIHGVVHGGVVATLIDAAGALAAITQMEGFSSLTTIEMKLNYLSSVKKGKILAYGHCIKLGRTIGVSEATIKNEDKKIIAHGLVTLMTQPPTEFPRMDKIPSKFI
jgi:acyl-CoA thioesterase